MRNIMVVFGTRPEAIKMCPLVLELCKRPDNNVIVCVTGQHRQMLDQVLMDFNIIPDIDLHIMKEKQTLFDITINVMNGIKDAVEKVKPDIVLVHGDTSTTLNGALAAFYNQKPIGHVEAGLRTGDIYSPFPEEANRKLTGAIATLHFAATKSNKKNLEMENIHKNIYITGNTVIDSLLSVINNEHKFEDNSLNNIDFENKKVILLTAHRRENWGEPMKEIFKAVNELVIKNDDVDVIFPMHKNPLIREIAAEEFKEIENRVHLIEPLEYVDFANLMAKCYLIMTDSGGIQEEAPALGKPVMVLRTETERPEAIEAGTVKLAGIKKEDIFNIANELVNDKGTYENMAHAANPYGDGKTSEKIVNITKKFMIENKLKVRKKFFDL